MKQNPLLALQHRKTWQIWLFSLFLSTLLSEAVSALMGLWLKGEIQPDYLLTGLVTACFVALLLAVIISYFLKQLNQFSDSQRQLQTIIELEPECVKLLAADGAVLQMNRAGLKILEADSLAQLLGQQAQKLVMPEYRADFVALIRRVFQGESANLKFEVQGLKGARRWLDSHAVPLRDADGKITALLAVTRDITEHKHAEAELRASEQKFRLLIERIPIALSLAGNTGELTYINERFKRTFGYTLEEIPTIEHWYKLAYPDQDYRQQIVSRWHSAVEKAVADGTEIESAEYNVTCKNGKVRVMMISGIFFENSLLVMFVDITERKQSEAAIAESRNLLQTVLDTVPVRVFWKDTNLCFLGGNMAFAKDAGMKHPKDLVGKDDYQMGWKDQADIYRADDRAVIESGIAKLSYDVPQTTPDGKVIWLRTFKVQLKNQNNEIIGLLGVYEDITERKLIENEILETQNQLRATIDAIPDLLFEIDLEGRYHDYHAHRFELLAAPPEQILGKKITEVLSPDAAAICFSALQEAWREGWSTGKQIQLELSEGLHWFELSVAVKPGSNNECPHFIVLSRDITKRKQLEQQLHNISSYTRNLIEVSLDPLVTISSSGKITDLNKATEKVTGFSREELLNTDFANYFTEPHRARIGYQEAFSKGYVTDYALVIKHRHGHLTDVVYNAVVYKHENGEVAGVFAAARDITVLRRTEAELRELNRDFVTFLENTSDFIYFKDKNSRIRFCSQTLANITQHKNWRDLIGKNDFEIFPPEMAQIYYNEELSVFTEGKSLINRIEPYYNQEGAKGWVSTSKWPVFDLDNHHVIGIFGISRDITQLKKIEQSLQESELMLKEAQQISHLGHWTLDIASNALYWSDEIYRIFGVKPQEFTATYPIFLDYVHPEDRGFVDYSYKYHLNCKIDYSIEHRILLKDGTVKFVFEKCKTEFDQEGKPLRSIGVVLDITERRQAEELLREKTDALLRSNADLEQFAYSISHDMRQPLRSITGHLQLLARSLQDKIDDEEQINLNFALDGAKRMDAMILSLLDYSRVGRKTETKIWLDSRAVLEEALEFLSPAISDANAEINITGEWGQVFASQDELSRLLMNLIGNAVKYREPHQQARVDVDSTLTANSWKVSVRDYGIGINPQQADRLFKFFSRLQSRARFEGTGMGLALCRRIVEHHDGKIWLESAGEGRGCCFFFELPLPDKETGQITEESK